MNIKDYYDGLETIYHNKALEKENIESKIAALEKEPIIEEYKNLQRDLDYLQYKYNKREFLNNLKLENECDHPLYMFEYDLASLSCVIPCARCVICGQYFFDIDDLDLTKLYDNKRLIAKMVPLREDFYSFGYTDYHISIEKLRKIYYKLYDIYI